MTYYVLYDQLLPNQHLYYCGNGQYSPDLDSALKFYDESQAFHVAKDLTIYLMAVE